MKFKLQIASTDWPKWLLNFFDIDYNKYPDKLIVEEKPNYTCEDPLCKQRGCFHGEQVFCTRHTVHKYYQKQLPVWVKIYGKIICTPAYHLQKWLHTKGIAIHDPINGRCTIDFMCCQKNWRGSKYEGMLGAISKAAQNEESTVHIQKPKNPN